MDNLLKVISAVLKQRRAEGKEIPTADILDHKIFPYAIAAGDNRAGFDHCALCGKPPTKTDIPAMPLAFLFANVTSAREYWLSGLWSALSR